MHALKLESELLNFIDGTLVGWPSVHSIKICQKKIRHFLKEERIIDGISQKFLDLAVKEKQNSITLTEREGLAEFIADFVLFFEPFIITLEPIKKGITPLIEESCQRRNRTKSLLLAWTKAPDGTTQELFRTNMITYRALAELCMDLLNFMEDVLQSCPKAIKAYHDFIDHYLKVEPLVEALLKADQIVIHRHSELYYDLIKNIVEHYGHDEQITMEKTTKLYNAYNIKKRLQ
jgi:hypothetical protein